MYKTKEEEPEEQAIVEMEEVTEVKVATISKPSEDVVDNIQWLLSQIQGDEEDEDELIMTKLKKAIDKTPTPLLRFISECANSKQETPPWGDVSEEDRTTLTELGNEDYNKLEKIIDDEIRTSKQQKRQEKKTDAPATVPAATPSVAGSKAHIGHSISTWSRRKNSRRKHSRRYRHDQRRSTMPHM